MELIIIIVSLLLFYLYARILRRRIILIPFAAVHSIIITQFDIELEISVSSVYYGYTSGRRYLYVHSHIHR